VRSGVAPDSRPYAGNDNVSGAKRDGTAGKEEVFFHQRQVLEGNVDEAQEGQTVRFHIRYAEKGPEALNVELGKR
jgi:cold shock CspA family protein